MFPSLDIFKIDSGGVLWRGAAESIDAAKARIQKLALSSPGEYLILNQNTGDRIRVTPLSVSTQLASVQDVLITAGQAA
jgi:hypothetical protein